MTENPTLSKRIRTVTKYITVEPVGFAMLLGSVLASTTTQTLVIEKTCRVNLNLSEAVCDAVRNQDTDDNADNERIVQEYVARLIAYKTILTSVLPCILLIFAGGWMDVTGRRKIIMFLSVIGEILVQINNIINVVFFYQLRVGYLIFFEGFFGSIFGGWALCFMAILSYLADITTERNRTYRIGLAYFAIFVAQPIGTALSGIMLKNFGYLAVYITSLAIALLNTCYLLFILSDPVRTREYKSHDNRGFVYFMKTFFNPRHLLSSLKVIFRKTSDNRMLRLCLLIVAICFLFGPLYGESAILYMSTRYRFGWDELQFSNFMAYNMVVTIIGSFTCVVVISHILGWHDSILGILTCSSKIASSFVYAFATAGSLFYVASVVDIFNGNGVMAMRSIFSKSVESNEIGKMNSIVGILEVIMPLVYVPLYTRTYTATMGSLPGFVFLLGTILSIPTLLVFIWLLYRHLMSARQEKISSEATTL